MKKVVTVNAEYVLALNGAGIIQPKHEEPYRVYVGLTKPASDTPVYFDAVNDYEKDSGLFTYSGYQNVYIRCPPIPGNTEMVFITDEV